MEKYEYTNPKNTPVSTEAMKRDLIDVATKLATNTLTQKLYSENGKYDVTNLSRRFGSWNKALETVGLSPGNIFNYSDEELYENILTIWQHKGKQPTRRELAFFPSKISQGPYNRRFQSWSIALQKFIEYANDSEDIYLNIQNKQKSENRKTNRDPSLRLRFKILKRDSFTCTKCGASPSKDSSVELHVDHIIPWSKGGETTLENLQTLCSNCNLGKSNLE
jgi:hypothetical protein